MTGAELHDMFRGVNYVRNGRDVQMDGGLDCWGFVRAAWAALGMPVPPEFLIDDEELRAEAFMHGRTSPEWERLAKPEPWALCLLSLPGRPNHCGVVSDDSRHILHLNTNGIHYIPIDAFLLKNYAKEYYRYSPR